MSEACRKEIARDKIVPCKLAFTENLGRKISCFEKVFIDTNINYKLHLQLMNCHVIGVCLPSQSASEKHDQEKTHIPLRTSWTSQKLSAMFDNPTIFFILTAE